MHCFNKIKYVYLIKAVHISHSIPESMLCVCTTLRGQIKDAVGCLCYWFRSQ